MTLNYKVPQDRKAIKCVVSSFLLLSNFFPNAQGFVIPSASQTSLSFRYDDYGRSACRTRALSVVERQADVSTSQTPLPSIPRASVAALAPINENKVRRLRDLMWIRETMEDLTATEFAINLDQPTTEVSKRRKRAVDYDNLLAKLNRRMRDLSCERGTEMEVCNEFDRPTPGKGMACTVYSDQEREDLYNHILRTRRILIERMHKEGLASEIQDPSFSLSLPDLTIPKEEESVDSVGPKLYVRADGTVDWDGALQDQAALKNFGTAVWARINGRDPEELVDGTIVNSTTTVTAASAAKSDRPAVTAKIEETDEIRREKDLLDRLESEYRNMDREHLALLNSAISAGQVVANINFATLEPGLRRKINDSSARLEKKREEVVYQRLIYELERIYTYLAGEMGNPSGKGYIPLQDRLNVAEFGLLESQVAGFKNLIESGEFVDADVLAVVSDQVTDFKRRLGIDYYVTGLTLDKEAILTFSNELLEKTKKGLAFYVKGCKLLWNDLVFATKLILRALQGYTLKPREVRNLRRTFKDFVTFIPVVIILIIPLSPVGHVLVFGAIQRVFPDFFPSCFSERRQNLLELYESAEYSEVTIDESFSEKVVRVTEAFFFVIAKYARKLYASLRGLDNPPEQ